MWLFILGTALSAFGTFVVGSSGKFVDPEQRPLIAAFILGAYCIASIPGMLLLAWAYRAELGSWGLLRLHATACAVAGITLLLISVFQAVTIVAAYCVRLFTVQRELYVLVVHLIVAGVLPCAVLLVAIAVVRVIHRVRRHADA